MPGMSGVELMRESRQRRPELRVLLMTGNADVRVPPVSISYGKRRFDTSADGRRVRPRLEDACTDSFRERR